jgi:hypothetical protein
VNSPTSFLLSLALMPTFFLHVGLPRPEAPISGRAPLTLEIFTTYEQDQGRFDTGFSVSSGERSQRGRTGAPKDEDTHRTRIEEMAQAAERLYDWHFKDTSVDEAPGSEASRTLNSAPSSRSPKATAPGIGIVWAGTIEAKPTPFVTLPASTDITYTWRSCCLDYSFALWTSFIDTSSASDNVFLGGGTAQSWLVSLSNGDRWQNIQIGTNSYGATTSVGSSGRTYIGVYDVGELSEAMPASRDAVVEGAECQEQSTLKSPYKEEDLNEVASTLELISQHSVAGSTTESDSVVRTDPTASVHRTTRASCVQPLKADDKIQSRLITYDGQRSQSDDPPPPDPDTRAGCSVSEERGTERNGMKDR